MAKKDKTREFLSQLVSDLESEIDFQNRLNSRQTFLIAADGRFLGSICSPNVPDSIVNLSGPFGSVHGDTSIHNRSCTYGSPEGELSLRNPNTDRPPLLFVNGEFWGLVTDNMRLQTRSISSERFLKTIMRDWRSVERGEFSDSGSIHVAAEP